MKKLILFIAVTCITCLAEKLNAQTRHTYGYYMMDYDQSAEQLVNRTNKIAQKTIVTARPRSVKTSVLKYDSLGRTVLYDNGKYKVQTTYYDSNQKKGMSTYKKNKLVERDSFLYAQKKILAAFYFDKNNRVYMQENYKYDDSARLTEYALLKTKRNNLTERFKRVMEYYPDGSFKKITFYENGKLDHYSLFDCNPAGENHKSDSVHNCVKYDVDSLGNKMKITIRNDKNLALKTVEYFNTKDELIAVKQYDVKKNRIRTEYHYVPGKKVYTTYIYYKKGKENYRSENTFDDKLMCTVSHAYSRKKLKFVTTNTYTPKGLMETCVEKNLHNKRKMDISYTYLYF